jgi:5-methylcytosine-specific restriction endonuclease McrA
MSRPTAEEQLRFLTCLQRLLADGQFVATYKYALLLALADIAVESGDDSGAALQIPTTQIAEKFIQYYWRQCVPYMPRMDTASGHVLRQNTGRQAAIVRAVYEARTRYGDSLATAQRHRRGWHTLIRTVDQVVREMPLWKLQTVGRAQFDFLYENRRTGASIELRPGVAYCLRHFYGLIDDLVRGAWVRYVRRHNQDVLGTTTDVAEFLFGSERSNLRTVREILEGVQSGRCFYCERPLPPPGGQVDHFIPWAKYPVDLGHNFVLAHASCNAAQADHLAAAHYLAAWAERNARHQGYLEEAFTHYGVLHDLPTSVRIVHWAYQQTFDAGGLTWLRRVDLIPLPIHW